MIAFHSDIVGSLLRPSYLLEAREQLERGELNPVDFKRIEDRAVDEAVTLQESAGLEVVTDGEMRRYAFYGGKPNQPPLKLRRSAGTLAKAEGRRAKRVSEPRGPRRACFARWGGSGGGPREH